jgi:hypothetical protein
MARDPCCAFQTIVITDSSRSLLGFGQFRRGFIESVLDWATAHNYRTGPNPARWKGCLREALLESDDVHIVTHDRAPPHQDIAKLVAELLPRNDLGALCMLLIICTAVRLGAATAGPLGPPLASWQS